MFAMKRKNNKNRRCENKGSFLKGFIECTYTVINSTEKGSNDIPKTHPFFFVDHVSRTPP